jgi:hypothetical protein
MVEIALGPPRTLQKVFSMSSSGKPAACSRDSEGADEAQDAPELTRQSSLLTRSDGTRLACTAFSTGASLDLCRIHQTLRVTPAMETCVQTTFGILRKF